MSWKDEIEELRRREELARRMGGEESVARQHEHGKLTVRERIDGLVDDGTFHETGALAGRGKYGENGELEEFRPSNFVFGRGRIEDRKVVVAGDDFTVRGGAQDGAIGNKMGYSEKMALELKLPLVRLVDGTGGGGSVKTLEKMRGTYVPAIPGLETSVELLSTVPVVGAAMGSVAGLGAMRVAASHFRVMIKDTSQVFVAGPPVVERGSSTTWPRAKRTRSRSFVRSCAICRPTFGNNLPSTGAKIPRTAARRNFSKSFRAGAGRPTTSAVSSNSWSTAARSSRWAGFRVALC
jgi:acetyl-CoA carboxylase carboxyltransferase component